MNILNTIMEPINSIVNTVNFYLWNKNILVVLLIGGAVFFTINTKFIQFRLFSKIPKILFKCKKDDNGISSLETLFLGTACRVGAGNIAGVVAAISVGGPGSIFWMWLVALLGSATAFIESSLAVIYSEKKEDGKYIGGTPFILKKRFNLKIIGLVYALASIICYLGVTQIMSNSITTSISSIYVLKNTTFTIKFISILSTLIVFYIVFLSKSKKDSIVDTLNKIVPIMALIYIVVVSYILIVNFRGIPTMIYDIFSNAFGFKQAVGGGLGAIIITGVKRGLFSNEAGSGNSNYASSTVASQNPTEQGMIQSLGVFFDTIIICSSTAFVLLLTNKDVTNGAQGMDLFQKAMTYHIGILGNIFVIVIMFFFCISTILAVIYYGRSATLFIKRDDKLYRFYQVLIILMIYIGGVSNPNIVWNLADFGLGIMTFINIILLMFSYKESIKKLKEYEVEKIVSD